MFTLAPLPFDKIALAPVIDATTIDFHYGKHHQTYVDKLNGLIPGTEFEQLNLEDIISKAPAGPMFNNAAQIWNHTFYWNCLIGDNRGGDGGFQKILETELVKNIIAQRGSFDLFKEAFSASALNNFGSGWTWLVKNTEGKLEILNTSNAGCPLTTGATPLLTIDIWEHAYYLQYQNRRAEYIEKRWTIVNWEFVEKCNSK